MLRRADLAVGIVADRQRGDPVPVDAGLEIDAEAQHAAIAGSEPAAHGVEPGVRYAGRVAEGRRALRHRLADARGREKGGGEDSDRRAKPKLWSAKLHAAPLKIVPAGHEQGHRRERFARQSLAEWRADLPLPVLITIERLLGLFEVAQDHQKNTVPELEEFLARHELGAERGIADQHQNVAHALEHDEMQVAVALDQHDAGNTDLGDLVEADLVALG